MPSWVSCSMIITGPGLEKFYKDLDSNTEENNSGQFWFEKFVPHKDNWGTDSELKFDRQFRSGDRYQILFFTRWTAPINFVRNFVHRYPNVKVQLGYVDAGSPFYGEFIITKGKCKDIFYNRPEDFVSYPIDEYGRKIYRQKGDTEEEYEQIVDSYQKQMDPVGKLRKLVNKYGISDYGG